MTGRKRQAAISEKLDEILAVTHLVNEKIDRVNERVDDIDVRIRKVEQRLDRLAVKAIMAGGISGLVVSVGIELLKAKFGG